MQPGQCKTGGTVSTRLNWAAVLNSSTCTGSRELRVLEPFEGYMAPEWHADPKKLIRIEKIFFRIQ